MSLKLHILSDIHLEFGKFHLPKTDADVLILAGDIGVGKSARNFIDECRKEIRTLYVPGNHEYYVRGQMTMEEVEDYWREVLGEDFLQKGIATINGYKIGGCTLWTDMSRGNPITIQTADYGMNDFHQTTFHGSRWSSEASAIRHAEMLGWLMAQRPDVVVSHHAPSFNSIDSSRYNNPMLDPCYASELEQFIYTWNPKLWVHGHIHKSNDYMIGTARVVSNPRGYMNHAENRNFNPSLVIEVS